MDDALLSALAQIKQAYEYHMRQTDELDHEAPLKEAFELDRICYNKQLGVLQECIKAMIKASSIVGENAHNLEIANTRLRSDIRIMESEHKAALDGVRDEFERLRVELETKVAKDYAILKDYKE